jgi:hypothetical protein
MIHNLFMKLLKRCARLSHQRDISLELIGAGGLTLPENPGRVSQSC